MKAALLLPPKHTTFEKLDIVLALLTVLLGKGKGASSLEDNGRLKQCVTNLSLESTEEDSSEH
jgi:hypothetical protein